MSVTSTFLQTSIVLDIFEPIQQKAKKCFDIGTKPPGEYDDDQKQLLFLECDNRHEHIDFKTLDFFTFMCMYRSFPSQDKGNMMQLKSQKVP